MLKGCGIVAVTYPLAILAEVVLGLWLAGLRVVRCPPSPTFGICVPEPRFSHLVAGLLGLAAAVGVLSCGIAVDRHAGRRARSR